jgi:UDP-N-acetyl-D-mannosaminuronic acid dehydrogenase
MMSGTENTTVCVIGLGYIGLPTAAMFASRKVPVIGVDVNRAAVDTINEGRIHIVEPELDIVVRAAVEQGLLRAQTEPAPASAYLIAVPTPIRGESHSPDVSYVRSAAQAIAPHLRPGNLVVLESTSPVGTTEAVAAWLAEARPDLTFPATHGEDSDIRVAYCPERVLPGKVIHELVANDRLIGGLTQRCSREATDLYRVFVAGDCIATNARTAEMAKLTENSYRDVNIAFANELSVICDGLGIDVWELIALANRHPRVNILQPGPGVGGHCIAVDPWFIVASSPEQARLIRTARTVNDAKPAWVLEKITTAVADHLARHPSMIAEEVAIACYGLAFKPDIDDLRGSPALDIARHVVKEHSGPVLVVEPNVSALPAELSGAEFVNADAAAARANIHVLLVDHREFRGMDQPDGIRIDTRGMGW